MSEIVAVIDTLENRIQKLIGKIGQLESANAGLREELQRASAIVKNHEEEIVNLKTAYDNLKFANAMLGSEENKRDTKHKINSLIREIDYCIAQLAD